MINQIKYIFLIVVSVMLTTISSCSSRRMNKTKIEEQSAVKIHSTSQSDSSVTYSKGIALFKANSIDKFGLTNNLDIEYDPTFDKNGNLIPFNYSRNENGNVTNVNITGNAKVKDTSTREKLQKKTEETYNYKEDFDKLTKYVNKLESEINSLKNTKTKEVKVAPDYIKYLIWMGTGFLLLTAIVAGLYIYFRVTIRKYTTILKNITQ